MSHELLCLAGLLHCCLKSWISLLSGKPTTMMLKSVQWYTLASSAVLASRASYAAAQAAGACFLQARGLERILSAMSDMGVFLWR